MVVFANPIPALLFMKQKEEMEEGENGERRSHTPTIHLNDNETREINRRSRNYLLKTLGAAICATAICVGGLNYVAPNNISRPAETRETIKPYVCIGYNPLTNRTGVEIR
jgi:hypothetical protein